jgi:hypothetical protein
MVCQRYEHDNLNVMELASDISHRCFSEFKERSLSFAFQKVDRSGLMPEGISTAFSCACGWHANATKGSGATKGRVRVSAEFAHGFSPLGVT